MLVLGISGGIDSVHDNRFDFPRDQVHDSAAVLVQHGQVIAAVEQERLDRIKHTNKAPGAAIRFCLQQAGAEVEDLDAVAYYATEEYCNRVLQLAHLLNPTSGDLLTPRAMVQRIFRQEFDCDIDSSRIRFVGHHWAHAVSAYYQSGMDAALVMTIDGQGEGVAGMMFDGRGRELTPLRTISEKDSLGFLYRDVIRFLGYDMFDEYKVMGMAPYGNAARFRQTFRAFYELLPHGEYRLHLDRIQGLYNYLRPRRRGEELTELHYDLAAALQQALEAIGLHVAGYFQQATGHRTLCLAGGVAHNCSLNGRLSYSNLFDRVFVQPASHDAGCALGAALAVHIAECPHQPPARLEHVYWGTDTGDNAAIARELERWAPFLDFQQQEDIFTVVARLLAERRVVGWVQGRSEFGPRALGNRSILADPRPPEHKDIINRMVKKREAYRPFAPSVLEERVDEFFVAPASQKELPFMTVVVKVQADKRELLGAITHVDGTARVQTVSQASNPRFWQLIDAFDRITGVPILLNTSFNNHAEPIVDSVRDAIVCFLTTGLHALVLGDYLVTKRDDAVAAYEQLRVALAPPVALRADLRSVAPAGPVVRRYEARFAFAGGKAVTLSPRLHAILANADGMATLSELLDRTGIADPEARRELSAELQQLWSARMVTLAP